MKNFYYLPLSMLLLPYAATSVISAEIKNPVELTHYIGALEWCRNKIAKTEPQRQNYLTLQAQAQKELDEAIKQKMITQPDVLLITQRVKEQGRYLGEKLNENLCSNLSAGEL